MFHYNVLACCGSESHSSLPAGNHRAFACKAYCWPLLYCFSIGSHQVSYFAKYRDDLFGDGKKSADVMSRTSGLDNQGIVALQRQVMRGMPL